MTARKKTRESKGDPGTFSKVGRSRFYREFKHDHGHGNENLKKVHWYISLVFSARLGRDIKEMLESLRCDDSDGNENVNKAIRLD